MSRLAPIERPRGVLVRLGAWFSRRKFGKVLAPLSVFYARMPRLVRPQMGLIGLAQRGLSLPKRLRMLIDVGVAMHNGCAFCADMTAAMALDEGLPPEDIGALRDPDAHPQRFSATERAVLAWAYAVADRTTTDALFERLREHLPDERQIVEVTWLASMETYLNTMSGALQLGSDGLCEARAPQVVGMLRAEAS